MLKIIGLFVVLIIVASLVKELIVPAIAIFVIYCLYRMIK